MKNKHGICYLVGAGPGDPGLLTLRGRDVLSRAEVVVYDNLVNRELLGFAPETAELVYAGKKSGDHTLPQEEINRLLVVLMIRNWKLFVKKPYVMVILWQPSF
jgi:uroporphyrinogen III methyltransferase/synthase